MARSVDSRPAGVGDLLIGLWIAEAARERGEEIPIVEHSRADIVRIFGHEPIGEPREDNLVLGSGSESYESEIRTADHDRSLRVERWQRTSGWNYGWKRPTTRPLSPEAVGWAEHMLGEGPVVVIAPIAAFNTRTLPMQKWLRTAWSLHRDGVRTIAIDGRKEPIENFPLYAFGFGWEHIVALLSRAAVVVGNDSGIAHLSATVGTQTIVAMGPTDSNVVFGHCLDVVTPLVSNEVSCVGCHFQGNRGFQVACDHGCDALSMIAWTELKSAIMQKIGKKEAILATN